MMIKRTLYFGNPTYLSLNNGQLYVRIPEVNKNDESDAPTTRKALATIPVEDIGIVVLDNRQITITQGLLDALLSNNTVVVTCDATHHPSGLVLPLCGHTIQTERFRAQIEASQPLIKQLWAQTVTGKIRNQATILQKRGIQNQYLVNLFSRVKSGDSNNVEATAAAYYWSQIFPEVPGFRRLRMGDPPNNALNYGYAILRATMARSIVGAGLLPTLGIHHHNRYNAYCLADDLMEPYRPVVDHLVGEIIRDFGTPMILEKEIKAELLKIPALDVIIDGMKSPLMVATQRTAVSLVKCYEGSTRKLLYPEIE